MRTHRIVTSPIHDARNAVDEGRPRHAALDEFEKLGGVIPTVNVIRLHALHPVKLPGDPLELLVLGARADHLGVFACRLQSNIIH